MTVSKHRYLVIRDGARVAKANDLHRLGGLLDSLADLYEETRTGLITDNVAACELLIDETAEYAIKVAVDLVNHEAKVNREAKEADG